MEKKKLNYTVKLSSNTGPYIKKYLKERFLMRWDPYYKDIKFLALSKNHRYLTVLPYKLFEKNLAVRELFDIARDLFISPPMVSMDPGALTIALKRSRMVPGKIMVHLPFLLPEFPILYKFTHPFIDMGSFNKEAFVAARVWLARQQKKWSGFRFSFFKFEFNRDRDLVDFYFKNAIRRFKYSKVEVLKQLKWFRTDSQLIHAAVLRGKTDDLIAVHFLMKMDSRPELFFCGSAFSDEFSKHAPGNALTFYSLCHIKETGLASRYHFGRIYPKPGSSYKLRWCEHSFASYLYSIGWN